MASEKNYDDLLYSILCSEGNIVNFFDIIFDFLHRRTDFFKLKSSNASESVGLIPGEAEQIVRSVFCKYMEQSMSTIDNEHSLPEYISEETVVTSPTIDDDEVTDAKNLKEDEVSVDVVDDPQKGDCKDDPKIPVMDPDSYNGASFKGYSWSQTLKDADIRLKVPDEIVTGKQVRVLIQPKHIKVDILLNSEWIVLKDEDLSWKINVEESTWTFIPRENIHICLQKVQERWWDSCFRDEPKIDLKSIDASIPFEDLDLDSRTKIDELMYNQHLKRLGKPTIQQSKVQNILREAWNCEGSPFKGQPFDPTLVDVQNSEALQ